METGKMMDMDGFAEEIRERLEWRGWPGKVGLQDVLKNNGIVRRGLLLYGAGDSLVPAIYLEPFFEAYRRGADMEGIVGKILDAYGRDSCRGADMSFFRSFPAVRDRVCMRLVNRAANAGFLAEVPHREFLDMAVTYYVDYDGPQTGAGTIQIHNSHMEMWGVTEDGLWEAACMNTPERKPGRVAGIWDVLAEISAEPGSDGWDFSRCMEGYPVPVLVITNREKSYGAAAVLYSGMLKQAADKAGSDLYILPSSLHEVMALPVNGEWEADGLRKMVMDVNREQLSPEEVLSDSVYIYRRELDRLEIA